MKPTERRSRARLIGSAGRRRFGMNQIGGKGVSPAK
jgi:hypothetical protein